MNTSIFAHKRLLRRTYMSNSVSGRLRLRGLNLSGHRDVSVRSDRRHSVG